MANVMRIGWSYADAVRGPVRQHKSARLTPIPTKDDAFVSSIGTTTTTRTTPCPGGDSDGADSSEWDSCGKSLSMSYVDFSC